MANASLTLCLMLVTIAAIAVSPAAAYHLRFNTTIGGPTYDYFAITSNYAQASLLKRTPYLAEGDVRDVDLSTSSNFTVMLLGVHTRQPVSSGGYDQWSFTVRRASASQYSLVHTGWFSLSGGDFDCTPYFIAPLCEWVKVSCTWGGGANEVTMLNLC